ncbi:MAG: PIN domain-containing protein [Vicinamibacterales bacterium]
MALRRPAPSHPATEELRRLIAHGRVAIVGPVRQEVLSGIREQAAFLRLRDQLRAFDDELLEPADYERAAEHFNTCRAAGVQGSNTDFLLCAIAERRSLPLLTTDQDFIRYARLLPLKLHTPFNNGPFGPPSKRRGQLLKSPLIAAP